MVDKENVEGALLKNLELKLLDGTRRRSSFNDFKDFLIVYT